MDDSKPGTAYDPERLGEPGQPGVPTEDQHPTNPGDDENIVADVDIPGPYPTGRGDPTGEPMSSEPAPTKETRDVSSLGEVAQGVGAGPLSGAAGGRGKPTPDYQYDDTPQGKIDKARGGSFPGGVPEDADVGTGRQKGQGMPPGSTGGHETPQTPPT